MKTKNLFQLVIVAFVAMFTFSFISCESESDKIKKALKKEIEQANEDCPISAGMVGDILSIKYDEKQNKVTVTMAVNEDWVSIDLLKQNLDSRKETMLLGILANDSKEQFQHIANANGSLEYVFKGTSGKSAKVVFTVEELKEKLDKQLTQGDINEMLEENLVFTANSSCPYIVEEGLTMISVEDDGENVIYTAEVDEELYDIGLFILNKESCKQSIKEMFNDQSAQQEMKVFTSVNRGIVYRYVGNKSKKSIDITFTPIELKKYLN